jgi:hypothetical protein
MEIDPKQRERFARLFERYEVGERVRAVCEIYGNYAGHVPEGAIGTISRVKVHGCVPLVGVRWGVMPEGWGDDMVTSAENLEPLDRPIAGELAQVEPKGEAEPFGAGGAFDLAALRDELLELSAAWGVCENDWGGSAGFEAGEALARFARRMPVVERAVALLEVLIKAQSSHG